MREAKSFCGEYCPCGGLAEAGGLAGAQAMWLLTDMALKLNVETQGRSHPSYGCAEWDGDDEVMIVLTAILTLAEASPRLGGLVMHRALRPLIKMGKRVGVPREFHARLSTEQISVMATSSTLVFLARLLPEVLDPPRACPACCQQPPCLQACSVDAPQLMPDPIEPWDSWGAAKTIGGRSCCMQSPGGGSQSGPRLRLQNARQGWQHRCAAAEHASEPGMTRPSQYRRSC